MIRASVVRSLLVVAVCCAGILVPAATPAGAGTYPGNKCVSAKLKSAAKGCLTALKAWSVWDKTQDDGKRDSLLTKAASKLGDGWSKAETKAAKKGVDCADMTLASSAAQAMVDATVNGLVSDIHAGLDLNNAADRKCGSKLFKAAAVRCLKFLKGESKLIKDPNKDPGETSLTAKKGDAQTKFAGIFDGTLADGCPSSATSTGVAADLDALVDELVLETTVSPKIPDTQFTAITMPPLDAPGNTVAYQGRDFRPTCATVPAGGTEFDPFSFFAKRGTGDGVNKLLVYYEGGGACWDFNSCVFANLTDPDVQVFAPCVGGFCDGGVNDGAACSVDSDCLGDDNPNGVFGNTQKGFTDLNNPANPFANWNVVFVPTCGGDVFGGDVARNYNGTIWQHKGFENAKVAEKYTREHFVNPDEIVIAGSSAGAVGITLHHFFWHDIYSPASRMNVLYDGFVDVITQEFLDAQRGWKSWDVEKNWPEGVPLPVAPTNEALHTFAALKFPQTNFAHFSAAFDSADGQGGFYHVMKNLNNIIQWPRWWDSICEWSSLMFSQLTATAAAAPANYRFYIASGTRHTTFRSDLVYTDTTGGVPLFADWVQAMIDRDMVNWTNVTASPFNVLLDGPAPGFPIAPDPRPSPLECPLKPVGANTVVDCSVCP